MKPSLIILLAAGPLFVFGQRLDLPQTFSSFQFLAPSPGRSGDTAFFRRSLTGSGERARVLPGRAVVESSDSPVFPVRTPVAAGFIVREMPPDRMPCLVPLWMPEQMPMNSRGNADPLPNAINKP